MMGPYLGGLLYGDGTSNYGKKNKAYAVWIDQHQRNLLIVERAKIEFQKLGLNVHYYSYSNKIRAMVYSKQLFREFREMKQNPQIFFSKLSKSNKMEFIAGFFDAEGTVTDRLVVYNGNIDILKEIQKFLTILEIYGKIYRYGKIHGLQIYKIKEIVLMQKYIPSIKILSSVLSVKKRRGVLIGNDLYTP